MRSLRWLVGLGLVVLGMVFSSSPQAATTSIQEQQATQAQDQLLNERCSCQFGCGPC